MTLHILPYVLPWFYYQFDVVGLVVVPSDFELFNINSPSKIAILTHTEMHTIGTNEASADDGSHITGDALVVVMRRQPISQ